mgnify:CR=1 FL=1
MKIRAFVVVVGGATQGEGLRVRACDFRRASVLVVQDAIEGIQLRGVEPCWEVKADEATCGDRRASHRRLRGQREDGAASGRTFHDMCQHLAVVY